MRIRAKQTYTFHDRSVVVDSANPSQPIKSHRVDASTDVQNVPDWIENTPEFDLLIQSGHIEIIGSKAPTITLKPTEQMGFPSKEKPADEQAKDENRGTEAEQNAKKVADASKENEKAADEAKGKK